MHTPLQATGEGGKRRGKGWDTMVPTTQPPVCLLQCMPRKGLPQEEKARVGDHLEFWLR